MSFSTQVVDGTLACPLGEAALGWTAHRFHWERSISRNLIEHMIAQFRERTLSSNPLVVNDLAPPNGKMVKCLMLAMLNKRKGSVTISGLHDRENRSHDQGHHATFVVCVETSYLVSYTHTITYHHVYRMTTTRPPSVFHCFLCAPSPERFPKSFYVDCLKADMMTMMASAQKYGTTYAIHIIFCFRGQDMVRSIQKGILGLHCFSI